jgi:hypothetical protein
MGVAGALRLVIAGFHQKDRHKEEFRDSPQRPAHGSISIANDLLGRFFLGHGSYLLSESRTLSQLIPRFGPNSADGKHVNAKWRFFGEGVDGLHLAYLPGLTIPVGKHDDDKTLSPGFGF